MMATGAIRITLCDFGGSTIHTTIYVGYRDTLFIIDKS
jgi:hypothetical protein